MNSTETIEKVYWSIGEVAEQFNVAPSLIRYWEKEFELISPKRKNSGLRRYTKKDIALIAQVYDLVKVQGFTLYGAKRHLNRINELESDGEPLGFCSSCGQILRERATPTGYVMTVDGISAHILMSSGEPIAKETQDALAELVKAAYKKEVQHG